MLDLWDSVLYQSDILKRYDFELLKPISSSISGALCRDSLVIPSSDEGITSEARGSQLELDNVPD